MTSGGPGSRDPGRITYTGIPLQRLVMNAYGLTQLFQIATPAWMENSAFTVAATMPAGTSEEQFRLMLQNLLAERFKLTAHRETREVQGYELVIAKGGPKLREAQVAKVPPPEPADMGGGRVVSQLDKDKDGLPQLPPGRNSLAVIPLMDRGSLRISARAQSLPEIVEFFVRQRWQYFQESRPIVDKTDLTGKYDFNLDFVRPAGYGRATAARDGAVSAGSVNSPGDSAPDFSVALEEQLGLRLAVKKVPTSVLVVDHAEKGPTGN